MACINSKQLHTTPRLFVALGTLEPVKRPWFGRSYFLICPSYRESVPEYSMYLFSFSPLGRIMPGTSYLPVPYRMVEVPMIRRSDAFLAPTRIDHVRGRWFSFPPFVDPVNTYLFKMFKSPFAIVSTSNAILAICAAVVLGISAYVEHAVSHLSLW